jgi:hypothetical protein
MRLTIAATLLTQAIPAVSSSQSKNVGALQKNRKMRRLQARKQRLDKAPAIQRSVLLEDPTIENMRLLENPKRVLQKECDPTSQFLDVGILSCGEEGVSFCQESEESSLGGYCDNYDYASFLCDDTDPEYDADMNCNCDDMDTTKTGIVRCLPRGEGCCVEEAGADSFCASMTLDYNLIEGVAEYIETCYHFSSPYEEKPTVSCTNRSFGYYTCEQTINDEACSSCAVEANKNEDEDDCILSDCWNIDVDGAKAGSTCDGVFPVPLMDVFIGDPTCEGNKFIDDDDDVDDGENKKKAIIASSIVIPALLTFLIVCYVCRRRKSTGKEAVDSEMEPSINANANPTFA